MAHCVPNSIDTPWLPTAAAEFRGDDGPARVIELPPPPVLERGEVRVEPQDDSGRSERLGWFSARGTASFLASFLFHFALILSLALWLPSAKVGPGGVSLTVLPHHTDSLLSSDSLLEPRPSEVRDRLAGEALIVEHGFDSLDIRSPAAEMRVAVRPRSAAIGRFESSTEYFLRTDADVSGALAGRGREARAEMVRIGGGTAESEDAVERGLRWMMTQQRDDGSFSFRQLRGANRNPGTESSTTAATAMCMLPYLGAGYTHMEGPYQDVVRRGMYYLVRSARQTPHGADLQNGTMYAQGLSAIALCEAYAMTGDPAFRGLAEQSVRFIVFAQNPKRGGWRYTPGEPGDTTVTGWQLMALKSGQMAGLSVPSPTLVGVRRFLDSVQSEYGAKYGYMDPRPGETTTAIGLLCRMYTGWDRDYEPLRRGVEYLDRLGPSKDNMYFNYYATQVVHHYGREPWRQWNPAMRDYLVSTQADRGHEAGSWHFSGGHGDVGGRLYNTAMAVMTLEVYYRYMPLYTDHALTEGF